ncbi:hypothetical protein B0T16DRAFT_462931 [Cercophora newfieldiana]|uniref:SWIM-type domain-containing protein n=1 Tax=Cercophora newfieldiana TaxID=92897 RepID=A0AA40CI23_9PEZI|nr:hypothetical protein B0T16DRAFT_462931 [Cercophora newfieldiana]
MATPALPTPRAVLTSLLNAITRIPLQPPPSTTNLTTTTTTTTTTIKTEDTKPDPPKPNPLPPSSNALSRVPPSHRHLLITLHVLFPSLLLPALDLLDRGLVARIILDAPTPSAPKDDLKPEPTPQNAPTFYLVHSAQASTSSSRRRYRHGSGAEKGTTGTGKAYIVRLEAWNCTCAAFAFSAFSVDVDGNGKGLSDGEAEGDEMDVDVEPGAVSGAAEEELSFGGLYFDDGVEVGVPICKHVLACLLGERWSAALGGYVVEWRVGREEMAGIVAEV